MNVPARRPTEEEQATQFADQVKRLLDDVQGPQSEQPEAGRRIGEALEMMAEDFGERVASIKRELDTRKQRLDAKGADLQTLVRRATLGYVDEVRELAALYEQCEQLIDGINAKFAAKLGRRQ